MTSKNNLYLELEPETNDQDLQQLSRYQNLYIKVRSSNLWMLPKVPYTSSKCLTVEILNNCKLEKGNVLEKFIHIHKPRRIVIAISGKINTELLDYLHSINFSDISVDLYWKESDGLRGVVFSLLDRFPSIKHISIYPLRQPLYLEHSFRGFTRYHHNMWSRNIEKYYAVYDLQTIRDRQYVGIGKNAVSRDEYSFHKNNVPLELDRKYVMIQDHIDRLNYYIPMGEKELESYPLISKREYMKALKTKETIRVHQELISNLLES